jgi:multidrug efflux pump subunit AcrA (membrane-fusion protein)
MSTAIRQRSALGMSYRVIASTVKFIVPLSALLLMYGCGRSAPAASRSRSDAPKAVKTETVRQQQVSRSIDVVGTLAAEDQVTIASQAEGAVSRVLADLGDKVKAGQVLIELDSEKLQYSLDSQKAALARALAKYGATDPAHLPSIEQTPDVQKAAAELAQARQAFERATELNRRNILPKQSLEDAETTSRSKQAAYDSALQNARNLSADIDASNAMVKLATRQLRDASIRAPFDGYVQKRLVSLGDFVRSQTPVMSIVRMDTLKATGEVPERMAPWVQVGQAVTLSVDAYPGKVITGTIARISPAVNTATRAFPFEATVPNAEGLLKPGTFARAHVTTSLVEPVLTVPYNAMQYRYGVYRVFAVTGDHLGMHELKTGDRVGDRMEILEGVRLGEQVALTDVDNLADGMKVTVAHGDASHTSTE